VRKSPALFLAWKSSGDQRQVSFSSRIAIWFAAMIDEKKIFLVLLDLDALLRRLPRTKVFYSFSLNLSRIDVVQSAEF